MKILQLIYESLGSPFGFGGAGVRAYEIYKRLKARHDITLLCMKYPGAKDGEIEGLRHVFVGTESRSLPKSVLSYTLKAAHFVRRYGKNYDVIIENFLPSTPFFSIFLTKTPVILQVQGIMQRHALRKYRIRFGMPMYLTEKVYPFLYDTFIFVTDVGVDTLMTRAKQYVVIPNGIDKKLLDVQDEEEDYILFFSRIDRYTKGIDLLIDAFNSIAGQYKDVRLILAGYETDSALLLIDRLPDKIRARAHYAGFVTGDEKIQLLSRAKTFVLPSRHESHPISVLEALACGRAVVVSNIPELQYVKENNIGITFRQGSAHDLSGKIGFVLQDRDLRKSLGEKGRKYASLFLWDDLALKFEDFLYKVAGEGNIRSF